MVKHMEIETNAKIPNGFIAYPAIFALMMYMFCYQFAYPFSPTIFLYFAFVCFLFWLFIGLKISFSSQMLIMCLVSVVSVIGAFYTKAPDEGNREAILTVTVGVFLVIFAQNIVLLEKMKKIICVCSFFVLLGVLLQYLFPVFVNGILSITLRSDSYERLMWSYNVDGAFAGFSAYTPDAAYFCAVLFGGVVFSLLQNKELLFKSKAINLIVIFLTVFAVVLTSKRGIAVALLAAFVLTYMIWRGVSAKVIASVVCVFVVGIILINVLSDQNEIINKFLQRFDSTDGDITTGRSEIWQRAIERLSNHFVGMGTGASYAIYDKGLHNIYLQLYYDHGIVGASVYLFFFIYNFIHAVKRKEPMAMFVQLIVLIYGITGNPIYSNSFFIVYIVFSVVTSSQDQQSELLQ